MTLLSLCKETMHALCDVQYRSYCFDLNSFTGLCDLIAASFISPHQCIDYMERPVPVNRAGPVNQAQMVLTMTTWGFPALDVKYLAL